MTLFGQSRSRKLVLAVTVSGICAAALAAPVSAEDGTEMPTIPATATVAVPELELDESVAAIVVDAVEDAADELDTTAPTTPAADDPGEEAGSEVGQAAAIEGPSTETVASAPVLDAIAIPSVDETSEADTTADSGDTVPDSTEPADEDASPAGDTEPASGSGAASTPASPPTPTSAPPPAATAALNVNVSVRVGSAGDNGAITQVNTGGAAPTQTSLQTDAGPESASTGSSPTSAAAPSSNTAPTWYWEWDCLSAPPISAIPPAGSGSESVPTSWTWIWNCPGNSEQYLSETPGQYQQINANVSIRISSPGDDGPVNQANVGAAVGVTIPPISLPAVQLPTLPTIEVPALPTVSFPSAVTTAPGMVVVLPGISLGAPLGGHGAPRIVLPPALAVAGEGELASAIGDVRLAIDAAVEVVLGAAPSTTEPVSPGLDDAALAPTASTRHPRADVATAFPGTPHPAEATTAAGWAPVAAVAGVAAAGSARATPHPAARRSKPAPSWTSRGDASRRTAPSPAPSGVSASAAGAGGSSGGGLPIFLALPFIVAVLDLARRVALERVTWPSGHRRRVPDTPG